MAASKTELGLDADVRERSSEHLSRGLALLIDLRQQVKQAHWNVTGSNFIGVHKLFDMFAEELTNLIDETAERQRAIGFPVRGTIRDAAELSTLPDYPEDLSESTAVLQHLVAIYKTVSGEVHAAIGPVTDGEDFGTADLFTEALRTLDQHIYLAASHLG